MSKFINQLLAILLLLFSLQAISNNRAVDNLCIELGFAEQAQFSDQFATILQVTKNVLYPIAQRSPTSITPHLLTNTLIYFILNKQEREKIFKMEIVFPDTKDGLLQKIGINYEIRESEFYCFFYDVFNDIRKEKELLLFSLIKYAWLYRNILNNEKMATIFLQTGVSPEQIEQVTNYLFGDIIVANEKNNFINLVQNYPIIVDFLAAMYMTSPDFALYDLLEFVSIELKSALYNCVVEIPSMETIASVYFHPNSHYVLNIVMFFWGIIGQNHLIVNGTRNSHVLYAHAIEILTVMIEVFELNTTTSLSRRIYPSNSAILFLLRCLHSFNDLQLLKNCIFELFRYPLIFLTAQMGMVDKVSIAFYLQQFPDLKLGYFSLNEPAKIKQLASEIATFKANNEDDVTAIELSPYTTSSLLILYENLETIYNISNTKNWVTTEYITTELNLRQSHYDDPEFIQTVQTNSESVVIKVEDILHHVPRYSVYPPTNNTFNVLIEKHALRIAILRLIDEFRSVHSEYDPNEFKLEFVNDELASNNDFSMHDHTIIILPTNLKYQSIIKFPEITPRNKVSKGNIIFTERYTYLVSSATGKQINIYSKTPNSYNSFQRQSVYLQAPQAPIQETLQENYDDNKVFNRLTIKLKTLKESLGTPVNIEKENQLQKISQKSQVEDKNPSLPTPNFFSCSLLTEDANSDQLIYKVKNYADLTVIFTNDEGFFQNGKTFKNKKDFLGVQPLILHKSSRSLVYQISQNNNNYVVKKSKFLMNEFNFQCTCSHENILKPIAIVTGELIDFSERYVYYVYPMFSSNLAKASKNFSSFNYFKLQEKYKDNPNIMKKIDENFARIFSSILKALNYIHQPSSTWVHRDVKFENVLVNKPKFCDCESTLSCICHELSAFVLADFEGICQINEESFFEKTKYKCSTERFTAPELQLKYANNSSQDWNFTPKSDMYSFGVMVVWLLFGDDYCIENHYRITEMSQHELSALEISDLANNLQHIMLKETNNHESNQQHFYTIMHVYLEKYPGLIDFCQHLIKLKPEARKSAAEMLNHPFIQSNGLDKINTLQ